MLQRSDKEKLEFIIIMMKRYVYDCSTKMC